MAAFEAISRLQVKPVTSESDASGIDIRSAKLPDDPPLNDFDPRDYRDPQNPIKLWMGYFSVLRGTFGTGILGMPLAISQTGMILGPILTLGMGILLVHSHLTLVSLTSLVATEYLIALIFVTVLSFVLLHLFSYLKRCRRTNSLKNLKVLTPLIALITILSQIGICTVTVVFTADSLRDICDWSTNRIAMAVLVVPYLILVCVMKTLKIAAYVGLIGNILSLAGIGIVFYHIIKFHVKETIYATYSIQTLFFGYGMMLFNMSAIGMILSVDKSLVNPKPMSNPFYGVVTVGIMTSAICGTIFGCLGFWSFGVMEENILRSLPFDETSSMMSIGLYGLAVAISYPLQIYPAVQITVEVIKSMDNPPSETDLKILEYIAGPVYLLISFSIGYQVPDQPPFVAFVGCLCTTMLSFVFPSIMELSLLYPPKNKKTRCIILKDLAIIAFGLMSWIFGIYYCGKILYVKILSKQSPSNDEFFR